MGTITCSNFVVGRFKGELAVVEVFVPLFNQALDTIRFPVVGITTVKEEKLLEKNYRNE